MQFSLATMIIQPVFAIIRPPSKTDFLSGRIIGRISVNGVQVTFYWILELKYLPDFKNQL